MVSAPRSSKPQNGSAGAHGGGTIKEGVCTKHMDTSKAQNGSGTPGEAGTNADGVCAANVEITTGVTANHIFRTPSRRSDRFFKCQVS